jgi:hypothetical protein
VVLQVTVVTVLLLTQRRRAPITRCFRAQVVFLQVCSKFDTGRHGAGVRAKRIPPPPLPSSPPKGRAGGGGEVHRGGPIAGWGHRTGVYTRSGCRRVCTNACTRHQGCSMRVHALVHACVHGGTLSELATEIVAHTCMRVCTNACTRHQGCSTACSAASSKRMLTSARVPDTRIVLLLYVAVVIICCSSYHVLWYLSYVVVVIICCSSITRKNGRSMTSYYNR